MSDRERRVVELARAWAMAYDLASGPCPRDDLNLVTEPCACDEDNERLIAAEKSLAEAVRGLGS